MNLRISTCSGIISSSRNHYIARGWNTTSGSGCDWRSGIIGIIDGVTLISRYMTNNFIRRHLL